MEGVQVSGGDGFDADMSQLDTNIQFTTVYFGSLDRSNDGATTVVASMMQGIVGGHPVHTSAGCGPWRFLYEHRLHEDGNDLNSIDSVKKIFTIGAGDTIFPGQTRSATSYDRACWMS